MSEKKSNGNHKPADNKLQILKERLQDMEQHSDLEPAKVALRQAVQALEEVRRT